MPSVAQLGLIVPAYNEAERIRSTLEAVRAFLDARGERYPMPVARTEPREEVG